MKKFLLTFAICLLIAGSVSAAEPIDFSKIPDVNQAVIYSCDTNQVKHAMSLTVASFVEEKIDLDVLYISKSEFGALASFKLLDFKSVKFPILNYIDFEPFVYIAFDNIGSGDNAETDWGFGAKIISIDF